MSAWKVATVRAVVTALVVGAMSAVTVWATTDDPKAVAVAGLTAGLGILAARLGVEGTIDSRRARPDNTV